MGESSAAASASADAWRASSSSIISLVQPGVSARAKRAAASANWATTRAGSATTPICTALFQPTFSASASTWMTTASPPILSPYPVRKSQSTPSASTRSHPEKASDRA